VSGEDVALRVGRSLARGCLSWLFLYSGWQILRDPSPVVADADTVLQPLAHLTPWMPSTTTAIRANAAVQLIAGSALTVGRSPCLAAATLAASLVPTTVAGHRFWAEPEPAERARQRIGFLSNVAVFGGLISILATNSPNDAPDGNWTLT
jgi:putative oxidoreductase